MNRALRLAAALLALAVPVARSAPDPARFTTRIDNPWFPLTPGSVYVYRGIEEGRSAREVVKVTHRTKLIQGVRCVVVDDRVYLDGRLAERTTDWYAQDRKGNVWYFGEETVELDGSGTVTTTEGSWEAGIDRAIVGLFMPAEPTLGQTARLEYLRGVAEDQFRVISLDGRAETPFVSSREALVTEEWTRLEPDVSELKVYVRGIGLVAAGARDDDRERMSLVSFVPGRG